MCRQGPKPVTCEFWVEGDVLSDAASSVALDYWSWWLLAMLSMEPDRDGVEEWKSSTGFCIPSPRPFVRCSAA